MPAATLALIAHFVPRAGAGITAAPTQTMRLARAAQPDARRAPRAQHARLVGQAIGYRREAAWLAGPTATSAPIWHALPA